MARVEILNRVTSRKSLTGTYLSLIMSGPKKSLMEGISSMAQVGALFAGEVAGREVVTQEPVRLVME